MFACFFARFCYQIALLIAGYTKNDFIAQTSQFVIANVASFYAFIGSFFLLIIRFKNLLEFIKEKALSFLVNKLDVIICSFIESQNILQQLQIYLGLLRHFHN